MFHLLLGVIYLAFISLGLPDALLGAAWPVVYQEFSVPVSWSGGPFMIIAAGTILSSLQSERLTRRWGTGRVTAASVLLTAVSLLGFASSHCYWAMCLWAFPYGLGAGSVDASLNNYVALHYASRHMSWLHCMWGIGASLGPYIMGYALTRYQDWNLGYGSVGALQLLLTVILLVTLPLWKRVEIQEKKDGKDGYGNELPVPLSMRKVFKIPGAKEVMVTFFCYCALEQTANLWASSYLALHRGLPAEKAASLAGLFFTGITAGRLVSGFLTLKFSDRQMVRLGQSLILAGILMLFLPVGEWTALWGLMFIGMGCAPVYPAIIHSTPDNFGRDKSQAMIGVQMASAYLGTCLMPPLFGLLANHLDISLLPAYLLTVFAVMAAMHERMLAKIR